MRWGLIRVQDQLALVFSYVDPKEGPSAKGTLLTSTAPTEEDARAAVQRPNVTVRLEHEAQVRPLSDEDFARLALPASPDWLSHVQPSTRPWRQDRFFRGRFHPAPSDVLEVLFLFAEQPEHRWVRVEAETSRPGTYEAVLQEGSHVQPSLTAGAKVLVRGARGVSAPVALSPESAARDLEWLARCERCGFDVLFEDSELDAFRARCVMCGGVQRATRRDVTPPSPWRWALVLVPLLVGGGLLLWLWLS